MVGAKEDAVKGWDVASLSDIEVLPGPETLRWTPVRKHFDIQAFGINAYTATEIGQQVVELHTESMTQHEEVYVVFAGSAIFTLGGEETDAPSGTIVVIHDPEVERSAVAKEPGTTVLAIGSRPGKAYTPSAWEHWYTATPLGKAGDYEGAIAELKDGLEHHLDHRMILYQLACWEARSGQKDAALEHLDKAVAQSELMREWAQSDEHFESIRGDPRFPATPESGSRDGNRATAG